MWPKILWEFGLDPVNCKKWFFFFRNPLKDPWPDQPLAIERRITAQRWCHLICSTRSEKRPPVIHEVPGRTAEQGMRGRRPTRVNVKNMKRIETRHMILCLWLWRNIYINMERLVNKGLSDRRRNIMLKGALKWSFRKFQRTRKYVGGTPSPNKSIGSVGSKMSRL